MIYYICYVRKLGCSSEVTEVLTRKFLHRLGRIAVTAIFHITTLTALAGDAMDKRHLAHLPRGQLSRTASIPRTVTPNGRLIVLFIVICHDSYCTLSQKPGRRGCSNWSLKRGLAADPLLLRRIPLMCWRAWVTSVSEIGRARPAPGRYHSSAFTW